VPTLDLGEYQMLDSVVTNRRQAQGLFDADGDLFFAEGLYQAQHLDIFLPAAFAHAPFQQAPQMIEVIRKVPML